jgi:hypothetical protein
LGGSCTSEADRCKAKQSRREEGADVWVLTSNLVRFSDLVQSNKNNFGNHGGALFSSISRKKSNRRCGRTMLNLIINTSRSPAGMTETDLAGLPSAFKDAGHPCQRSTSRSSRLSGLRTRAHYQREGALLKPAWMRDKANWLLWWRGCGVRPACHLVAVTCHLVAVTWLPKVSGPSVHETTPLSKNMDLVLRMCHRLLI